MKLFLIEFKGEKIRVLIFLRMLIVFLYQDLGEYRIMDIR